MVAKLLATHRAAQSYVQLSRYFARRSVGRPILSNRVPLASQLYARRFATASNEKDQLAGEPTTPTLKKYAANLLPSAAALKRPTRDELLAVTSGFLQRLRVRFKWFTIRGFRPYRVDDWSAFFSWVLGGVGLWVALGTTSFMASIFFLLNSLQMQEWLAAKLGAYMTDSTGIMVVFESAIVPRFSWTDSKITFKNVSIQRGAPAPAAEAPTSLQELFPVAALSDDHESTLRRFRRRASSLVRGSQKAPVTDEPDFSRTTYFQLSINEIEVSLSLPRWLDGKGIVKEAVIKGVRGLVDRRHIRYDPDAKVDRLAYRHTARPGDFHLEGLQVDDFLVTIYQPNDFRPYTCSIFAATIPVLRKQWLFLDLMSADSITGQIDNCLFSLHRPQSLSTSFMSEDAADHKASQWSKLSRFRIDGFNIDHLQSPHDQGALAWITAGKCDLVADIRFPRKEDENDSFEAIIGQIADSIDQQVLQGPKLLAGQKELSVGTALEAPEPFVSTRTRLGLDDSVKSTEDQPEPVIVIDLSVRFKDVKASIPLYIPDLSYVNNALVRPIVAFLNANRTLIPIKCRVEMPMSEFDGSWTTYDTGLLEALSVQVYKALAFHIHHANEKRAKQVGMWSLQLTARGVLKALQAWNEQISMAV